MDVMLAALAENGILDAEGKNGHVVLDRYENLEALWKRQEIAVTQN